MKEKRNRITRSVITSVFLVFVGVICIKNIMIPLRSAKALYQGSSLKEVTSDFEDQFNGEFPYKNTFVDINGLGHRVFLQRKMTDVILLENGQASALVWKSPDTGIQANAKSVTAFSEWFETEKNGNFLYVQVPLKNSKYDSQLPEGLVDYSNETADKFLANLPDTVDKLDLRESMEEDKVDFYSLYLSTEHHWNAYGGFYAFQEICQYMQENFNEEIDPMVLSLENYNQDILHDYSLGYYGQKTGQFFTGYDDFPLIYPKFETEQTCSIIHRDVVRSGTFYESIFDLHFLEASKKKSGTVWNVYRRRFSPCSS